MTYKLAKKYYNTIMSNGERMWPKDWIYELAKRGKLAKEQYKDITGEDYPEEPAAAETSSESEQDAAENKASEKNEETSADESGNTAGGQ